MARLNTSGDLDVTAKQLRELGFDVPSDIPDEALVADWGWTPFSYDDDVVTMTALIRFNWRKE